MSEQEVKKSPKELKKEAKKAKKELAANCASCKKPLKRVKRYYRDAKYFCNKRCWKAKNKKEETPAE